MKAATLALALLVAISARVHAAKGEPERSSASPDEASAGGAEPSQGSDLDEAAPPDDAVAGNACIDESIKADLFAKRKMRTTRDRLFQQTNRHELTAMGGYYVSDLFDGNYVAGGAYTYHMTEDLGVEASGSYTSLRSQAGPQLERAFNVLEGKPRRQLTFDADLVWVPAHAKMRLGGSITHLDLYVAAGGGIVDSVLSSDLAANAGFGLKFFLGHAWAIRFDVRDHFFRQQLLAEKVFVNDLSATLGLSLYLPLGE